MKKTFIYVAMIAIAGVTFTGCGGSKKAAGYNANQTTPESSAQQQSANRGLKLEREECEDMAFAESANLRASGNAISDKEAFAANLALLDARTNLAEQLEIFVNGLINNFNQQHEAGKDFSSVAKAGQEQKGYFEQFLTGTRPICKNTYVKDDGKYNVYVCIEMDEKMQRSMHKKLSEDKKISIDFEEHQFLKELEKAKEDYRKQRE